MKQYKTIETIEMLDKLSLSDDPPEEDCFFINNFPLKLAEALLFDFGEGITTQLGKILQAITDSP